MQKNNRLHAHRYMIMVLLIFLISIPVKLLAARDLAWDIDFVPVIARGQAFFDGGAFPAYGTLSSVAAYNLPFLVWMQMPLMLFTRDVAIILIGTQMLWNLLGTWFSYRLGAILFQPRVGVIAAILFTFSDTGISGAYTAWAQLLLPTFYVMVLYCLFQWRRIRHGRYAGWAIILSTAAFMTHFSAVLLYAAIVGWAVLARVPFRWRGIAMGIIISLLMFAPYISFQVERDFVDLRAFLSRKSTLSEETLAEYAHLRLEAVGSAGTTPNTWQDDNDTGSSDSQTTPKAGKSSRLERAIEWGLSIPGQIIGGLGLAFRAQAASLRDHLPLLYGISEGLRWLLIAFFGYSVLLALRQLYHHLRQQWKSLDSLRKRLLNLTDAWDESAPGQVLLLLLFLLLIIAGLIITRAGPDQQPTYYMGLFAIQMVMIAYGIEDLLVTRVGKIQSVGTQHAASLSLLILLIGIAGLTSLDRIVRVSQRDTASFAPLHVWRYDPIRTATEWIAADWGQTGDITISYDIMEENRTLWWVAPWHTVDPNYRIGMSYDHLLQTYHGLVNTNTNPIGIVEDPDYIITYERGLNRYDLELYDVQRFEAIFVLKPSSG